MLYAPLRRRLPRFRRRLSARCARIPFLADVARLESAWVEAYHAAEADALDLDALAAIAPDGLKPLRFRPHPAARLSRKFSHPAASIWAGSQGGGEPRAPDVWSAEEALVARPDADVFVRVLPPGGFAFAAALFSGASLGEAAALAAADDFDPGAHLVGLDRGRRVSIPDVKESPTMTTADAPGAADARQPRSPA